DLAPPPPAFRAERLLQLWLVIHPESLRHELLFFLHVTPQRLQSRAIPRDYRPQRVGPLSLILGLELRELPARRSNVRLWLSGSGRSGKSEREGEKDGDGDLHG